jgi:excisionase family DNA binding protein
MKVVEPGWLTQSPSRCGGRPGFGCMLDSLSTVPEALEILRISRTKFYQLVAEKRIALVKIGRRSLVRRSDLAAFIGSLSAAEER